MVWFRRKQNKPTVGISGRRIVARYDAARTTPENRRHWVMADNLSANAAMSPGVRQTLRNRARYEVANNGYARGMVSTLANYVIGTGPRLQMLTPDPEANRAVEKAFEQWFLAVGLDRKLLQMRYAQAESGEVFSLLATNPQLQNPVKLDLRIIEADQVTTPTGMDIPHDGIMIDDFGNPQQYFILRQHPGDAHQWGTPRNQFDLVPAEAVLHLYRAERPGQIRGIPEITAALPLFATLRRYTLAVLSAAENAADIAGVIYTDAPADGAVQVDPMDEVEINRGSWLTMPFGWNAKQIKAEQPTTVYSDFKREILNEIARTLNMPYNIAAGNSSDYNYASGRLDHQAFFKTIQIDRTHIEGVLLDRIFAAWLNEAVLVEGLLPQTLRMRDANTSHQWFWDGFEHVDPAKEANAQATRLASHSTTLAAEFARAGLDWEQELKQRAKEVALMEELGLQPPPEKDTSKPPVKPSVSPKKEEDHANDRRAAA